MSDQLNTASVTPKRAICRSPFGCTEIMAGAYAYILYMHYAMSFFGFVPYVPLSVIWVVSRCLFQCFKVINAPIGPLQLMPPARSWSCSGSLDQSHMIVMDPSHRLLKSPIALSRLHRNCCHGSSTRFSLTCMCILARLKSEGCN